VTRRCEVAAVGKNTFRIVLTQGLNRQIRRMCRHFGYNVRRLRRVRIMHLRLGRLGPGEWRALRTDEIAPLLPTRADPGTPGAAAEVRPARPTLRLRARRS
jgi:23S rRNA pseudouridine2604 synthase